jgi:hypothetical protein
MGGGQEASPIFTFFIEAKMRASNYLFITTTF